MCKTNQSTAVQLFCVIRKATVSMENVSQSLSTPALMCIVLQLLDVLEENVFHWMPTSMAFEIDNSELLLFLML